MDVRALTLLFTAIEHAPHPNHSDYCGQFSPTFEHHGSEHLGWDYVGGCRGTMGPTASPSFDSLADSGPCEAEWNPALNEYDAGDRVSVVVSDNPRRVLVFECKK